MMPPRIGPMTGRWVSCGAGKGLVPFEKHAICKVVIESMSQEGSGVFMGRVRSGDRLSVPVWSPAVIDGGGDG
jgi:hypothetical protein